MAASADAAFIIMIPVASLAEFAVGFLCAKNPTQPNLSKNSCNSKTSIPLVFAFATCCSLL